MATSEALPGRGRIWKLGGCVVLGAGLAPSLAFALPALFHTGSEPGATASAIDTAFFAGLGAGCGLAVASFLAVILMDAAGDYDRAFREGLVVGYLAFGLGVAPVVVGIDIASNGLDIFGLIVDCIVVGLFLSVFIVLGAAAGVALKKSM